MTDFTTDVPGLPPWPERAARRTAANAVLADFRREYSEFMSRPLSRPLTAPVMFDGINWALRLADNLSMLIQCVGDRP